LAGADPSMLSMPRNLSRYMAASPSVPFAMNPSTRNPRIHNSKTRWRGQNAPLRRRVRQ
jgi:hypothetical protein